MFAHQVKGIIAVSLVLAFIPFINFLTQNQLDLESPALSTSDCKSLTIEIAAENGESGIFFVKPETSVNQMFSQLGIKRIIAEDIKLKNGMKVRLLNEEDHRGMVIERLEAAKRLALRMPLDINSADIDELILVPGVGEALSANIITWREKIGRFEKLEQLMDINGIKEKKFLKLKQYFYIDALSP